MATYASYLTYANPGEYALSSVDGGASASGVANATTGSETLSSWSDWLEAETSAGAIDASANASANASGSAAALVITHAGGIASARGQTTATGHCLVTAEALASGSGEFSIQGHVVAIRSADAHGLSSTQASASVTTHAVDLYAGGTGEARVTGREITSSWSDWDEATTEGGAITAEAHASGAGEAKASAIAGPYVFGAMSAVGMGSSSAGLTAFVTSEATIVANGAGNVLYFNPILYVDSKPTASSGEGSLTADGEIDVIGTLFASGSGVGGADSHVTTWASGEFSGESSASGAGVRVLQAESTAEGIGFSTATGTRIVPGVVLAQGRSKADAHALNVALASGSASGTAGTRLLIHVAGSFFLQIDVTHRLSLDTLTHVIRLSLDTHRLALPTEEAARVIRNSEPTAVRAVSPQWAKRLAVAGLVASIRSLRFDEALRQKIETTAHIRGIVDPTQMAWHEPVALRAIHQAVAAARGQRIPQSSARIERLPEPTARQSRDTQPAKR